jgi:hypothetical protein
MNMNNATAVASAPVPAKPRDAIRPRELDVELAGVPRHWLANNAAATAVANGVNLLFPAGERFFVRSVKHYLDRITDPALQAQIRGFFGQEGRHARAHDRFNEVLRAQGYEVDRFLDWYERMSAAIEQRTPAIYRLATTAACEHFTAIMAEGAFRRDLLDQADPAMRALLAWHAAEEIEHKAVAYDVLRTIDPRYATRVIGLVMATALLSGFWVIGTVMLLRQDRLTIRATLRQLAALGKRDPIVQRVFVRGIRSYLRRDFHPSQIPNEGDAARWFAAHGLAMPEAA